MRRAPRRLCDLRRGRRACRDARRDGQRVAERAERALSAQLGTRLLPTSRLDVPTSGLLCFARTAAFQSHFNAALRERKVEKEYTALVMPGTAPLGWRISAASRALDGA